MITDIAGRKVSPVGIGTWGVGGTSSADTRHDAEHVEAIRFAIENGLTLIDTAEIYSAGHSEELVGRAIKGFPREDIYITTKVWHNHLRHDDVIKSARASLARLDTEYIDLYLIHWPGSSVPVKETVRAMEELVNSGIVRDIGVSNFSASEVEEAMSSTSKCEIAANQIEYSVVKKECEAEIIPFCEKNNVRIMAYSPINRGNLKRKRVLQDISEKVGHKPVPVALNYLMKRSIPIPKSTNRDHIMEFVDALSFQISEEDYEAIRSD